VFQGPRSQLELVNIRAKLSWHPRGSGATRFLVPRRSAGLIGCHCAEMICRSGWVAWKALRGAIGRPEVALLRICEHAYTCVRSRARRPAPAKAWSVERKCSPTAQAGTPGRKGRGKCRERLVGQQEESSSACGAARRGARALFHWGSRSIGVRSADSSTLYDLQRHEISCDYLGGCPLFQDEQTGLYGM